MSSIPVAPSSVLIRGLPSNHQIHRREELLLPARHQAVRREPQAIRRLLRPLRRQPDPFQAPDNPMREPPAPLRHPRDRDQIPQAPHHPQVPVQRVVPRFRVLPVGQVLVEFQFETGGFDGGESFGDADHVADAVALLDSQADLAVVRVGVVVGVGHEPFVDAEDAAGLEDAEDLAVDAFEGRGVDGGFDGVDSVEGIRGKGHLLGAEN